MNMEFPQDASTNVQSTLIPSVCWELYQVEHSSLDNTHGRKDDPTNNASSSKDTWDTCTKLLDVVRALRLNLRLAFFNALGLWIFQLVKPGQEPSASPSQDFSSLIQSAGLKFNSAGTLTTQQLKNTPEDPFSRARGLEDVTDQAFLPQAAQSFSSLGASTQASSIYRAFVSAILSFFADKAAARGDWSILGVDSCVRVVEYRRFATTNLQTPHWDQGRQVLQLCFDFRWSLSGTMTLYSRVISLPMLSRLSDVVNRRDTSGAKLVRMGAPIVTSPFASWCAFAGHEDHQSRSSTVDRQAKGLTRALLASCAIHLSSEVEWICLHLNEGNFAESNPVDDMQMNRLWWPAHLCFVLHASNRPESVEPLQRLAEGTFNDPLAEAEQWFRGHHAREAAIEAKEQEDKTMQLHEHDTSEPNLQSPEDDKTAISRTEQYLSAQEASGIYPTPPDGLTSHAQGLFVNQDSAGIPPAEARTSRANEDLVMKGSRDASPITRIAAGQSGKEEDQGLFGDLDTDMFNTNVLTEDDFNFFDEPGAAEDYPAVAEDSPALLREGPLRLTETDARNDVKSPNSADAQDVQMEYDEPVDQNEELSKDVPLFRNLDSKDQAYLTTPTSVSSGLVDKGVGEAEPKTLLDFDQGVQDNSDKEKPSSFDSVRLQNRRSQIDEKYRSDGRYAASFTGTVDGPRPGEYRQRMNLELPETGLLRTTGDESSEDAGDSEQDDYGFSDGNNDEQLHDSPTEFESNFGHGKNSRTSKKRKREPCPQNFDLATPAASVETPNPIIDTPNDMDGDLANAFLGYRSTRDLFSFCTSYPTNADTVLVGDDQDFIQIAQLVGDQRVLRQSFTDASPDFVHSEEDVYSVATPEDLSDTMKGVVSEILSNIQQHDLRSFTELSLDPKSGTQSKQNPRDSVDRERHSPLPRRGIKSHDEFIFEAQPPYLSAKRGEDAIEILPPALYFWEELGLAPVQQNKDVMAFCVYPENETIGEAASDFMAAMENAYQSCRFGRHRCASGLRKYQEGLVPVPIVSAKPGAVVESMHRVCDNLGADIPHMEASGADYVVYMVNPFNNDAMLPQLCAEFLRLSSIYASSRKKPGTTPAGDLVLQVIPLSFLANLDRLTIPPPKAYIKLAFELYSRCSPVQREGKITSSPFTSGSAVRLAKTIPRSIDFRLTPQPPDGLLGVNSSLHLAYSWETDQEWLACAWTDSVGAQQWTAVYCLQQSRPNRWAAFSDTVKEILDTTMDMLHPLSQPWKIYLVKDRELQQREQSIWRHHSASAFKTPIIVSVLSVDTNPPLAVPAKKPSITFPLPSSTMDTSPAATTPYDQVPTPDHPSPTTTHTPTRQTPLASGFTDPDPSARLIDVVSETWCLISPCPIPDPYLLTNPLLALTSASGYLLKRAGPDDEDGLLPLGVNLVTVDLKRDDAGSKGEQEKLLREILKVYADLACLARLRGTEDWKSGVLPWHLAAARRAAGAVTGCMRWGKRE